MILCVFVGETWALILLIEILSLTVTAFQMPRIRPPSLQVIAMFPARGYSAIPEIRWRVLYDILKLKQKQQNPTYSEDAKANWQKRRPPRRAVLEGKAP